MSLLRCELCEGDGQSRLRLVCVELDQPPKGETVGTTERFACVVCIGARECGKNIASTGAEVPRLRARRPK